MIASGVDCAGSLVGSGTPTQTAKTLRVYGHFFEERDRAAAEGLGRHFALPPG